MRRTYRTIGAVMLAVGAGCAVMPVGCAMPTAALDVGTPREGNARPASLSGRRVAHAGFASRLTEQQAALRRCLPGDDLLDSLYFGWMLEPYRRATLAIAVKTVAVLERELDLRERGGGNLGDRDVSAMLDWLEGVHSAAWSARAPGFQPQRIDVHGWADSEDGDGRGGLALFTIADRATATRRDSRFRDFDILAGAGFRTYVAPASTVLYATDLAALRTRADGLGVALIESAAPGAGGDATSSGAKGRLRSVSLSRMLAGDVQGEAMPAVVDPPGGESSIAMLARRQLLRGVTGGAAYAGVGLGVLANGPGSVRAAMWVQALAGQRIGVFEGWRDARDGSRMPHRSRLTNPAYLEAIAHTALDLLRYREIVGACRVQPTVALTVRRDHLVGDGANALTPEYLDVLAQVHAANVPFDLVPAGEAERLTRYAIAVDVPVLDALPSNINVQRHGEQSSILVSAPRTNERSLPGRIIGAQIADFLRTISPPTVLQLDLPDAHGGRMPVLVRTSADGRSAVIVNLGGTQRSAKLVADASPGSARGWTDHLTGRRVEERVALAPWQVRLLTR